MAREELVKWADVNGDSVNLDCLANFWERKSTAKGMQSPSDRTRRVLYCDLLSSIASCLVLLCTDREYPGKIIELTNSRKKGIKRWVLGSNYQLHALLSCT